jgi:hypothetical protein
VKGGVGKKENVERNLSCKSPNNYENQLSSFENKNNTPNYKNNIYASPYNLLNEPS